MQRLVASCGLVLLSSCFVGCSLLRNAENREIVPQVETAKLRESTTFLNERELCINTAANLAAKGHAAEAIALYEKAERLKPNDRSFDLELAPLFTQVGDSETAVAKYESAIADGHANSATFNNLAWTLMGMGRTDAALEAVNRGLTVAPDDQRLNSTQAVALYKKGDRQSALSKFEAIYGPSAAHHNLAVLDLEAGQIDAAIKHAKLAAEHPDCTRESLALHETLLATVATQADSASSSSK
ncbi:MAG: tetratricopeptide repeat protein [Pirellulaceae bacterium]